MLIRLLLRATKAAYILFQTIGKRHEKSNKGNFGKPFVYGRYATLHARVGENEKSMVRR